MNIKQLSKVSLSKEQAQDIRSLDVSIKFNLNFDKNNCYHIGKIMLNENRVNNHLYNYVMPKHARHLYDAFIYPMYFYLEYTNNFLTVDRIAEHYEIEADIASVFIETGKNVINSLIGYEV
tara:strand:- start:1706 stop:2068 length:363 start_codon:yes stop_codon:yes gene_type:complete